MKRSNLYSPRHCDGRAPRDCGAVAIQLLLDVDYAEARTIAFRHGFSSTSGTPRGMVNIALEGAGRNLTLVYANGDKVGPTLSQVVAKLDKNAEFLIYVPRHVVAMKKGALHNVNGTENFVVTEIYLVEENCISN